MKPPLSNIQDEGEVQEALIVHLRGIKPDAISDSANISQLKIYRILDSVDMLGLIAQLETMFAIQIRDEEVLAKNFETVGSLAAFVSQKLAQRAEVID